MRRTGMIIGTGGLAVALVAGTFFLSAPSASNSTAMPPPLGPDSAGPLDGKVFASALGLAGKPADIKDDLVFENGRFVSTECERRCKYPPAPYYVRREGDVVHFVSETRCPYKDATIVWRGRVADGVIKGEATWTMNRWYWQVENVFHFEGRLAEPQS